MTVNVSPVEATVNVSFELGNVVATPGALEALEESKQQPQEFLQRHQSGDWKELKEDDRRQNELALKDDLRIFSVFRTARGTRLWVITEADRSSTTLLVPDEY